MKREIKFKAWDMKLLMMSKPFSFGQILNFTNENGLGTMKSLGDEHVVREFSGVKDNKNQEIYEGDILKSELPDNAEPTGWCTVYNIVGFEEASFGFLGENTLDFYPFCNEDLNAFELVGNIFETADLLTTKL